MDVESHEESERAREHRGEVVYPVKIYLRRKDFQEDRERYGVFVDDSK